MADLKAFAENENIKLLFQKVIDTGGSEAFYKLLVACQDENQREKIMENMDDMTKTGLTQFAFMLDSADKIREQAKKDSYTISKAGGSDFENDINKWLSVKKSNSAKTEKLYRHNIQFFIEWITDKELNPIALKADNADDYLIYIKSLSLSDKTKASIKAAASSFFDWLGRQRSVVNPFRKSEVRFPKKNKKIVEVPNSDEVQKILEFIRCNYRKLYPIFSMIINHGMRAAAFENAKVYRLNNPCKYIFETITKGKTYKTEISKAEYDELKNFDFSDKDFSAKTIENRFYYTVRQMQKENQIKNLYSVHDLRHYFAVTEYQKDKDIYRVKTLLNHADISTTALYLKSLNVI